MPRSPELSAALFDLDDTLLDRRGAYQVFYRSFYDRQESINEDVPWPEASEFFWSLSPDNATNPREAFNAIQKRWPGVKGDPDQHFHDYFQGIIAHMKPLPGVPEFIEAMNASGIRWGVVTNGGEYQLEKVRRTGLEDRVPFVIATELHGASKPDPEPYLHALRLMELDESQSESILFVGDNPYTDIVGAHGVGMKTAWIHMGREFPAGIQEPHMQVDAVTDLVDVLGL